MLAYDVRNAARLRRVHKVATSWGDPLQYSVFICDLTKSELFRMKEELMGEMNLKVDSVAIFDLGSPEGRGIECIQFIGARRRLPTADDAIW